MSAKKPATRRGAIIATVANPAPIEATRKARRATKPKTEKPQPKVSKMAKKKKAAKSTKKKAPRRSNPENPARGMVSIPRGMMLVPVGGARKNPGKKRKGHPKRRNPEEPPHHAMLKNGAAAVGFGTLAATVGMLGGFALSKANLKNKFANVAANVATGAIVGGGVGMLDRTAGTVVAHNYMVAAGQWISAPDASTTTSQQMRALPAGRSAAASPAMLNRQPAVAMHGYEEPDPEAITPPHPAPQRRQARPVGGPLDHLGGYRNVSGLGSPLDHLGSPLDHLGGYDHVDGVLADDVGEFDHLHGIIADNLGDELEAIGGDEDHLDAIMADNLGEDELAASDDMDGDEELGYLRA